MRNLSLRIGIAFVVVVLGAAPALANWTASGSFQYVDRDYDETGFTGAEPSFPVRFADVEVVDASANGKRSVLATGRTDASGSYSIAVNDNQTRDVYVRVLTRSDSTADLNADVRSNSTGKAQNYAAATNTVFGHGPSTNVNFGVGTIAIGQGGEAFNIYDQLVRGMDYLASLLGARPGSADHLTVVWGSNNGYAGASYCVSCRQILLRDTAGYDDTVILHEMGHYAVFEFSKSDSPGGTHGFMECGQDLRLAFDEGFATYFGNSVLRHHQVPRSNQYVRTNGAPGAGGLVRFGDLETDALYNCPGATNELNNFSLLWDIVDGATTTDTTPGVDDPHDLLDLDDLEVWEVMTQAIPGATNVSLEDFWDGWFSSPIQNGFRTEMIALAEALSIEYAPDAFEPNDSAAAAAAVSTDGSATHATLFSDPGLDGAGAADEDWFSFSATDGQTYVVETGNLLSDGNTFLEIVDTDGTTVLASNDDRAAGDESSRVEWTAPRTDVFYARVTHAPDVGIYGSYDLFVAASVPVDNDGDGYNTTTDCNDADPTIHPNAAEMCDGVDQDCDGVVDNGFDADGDGYSSCGGDCDDTNAAVNPGAAEVPANGIDDNCNGQIDEAPPTDVVTITKASWKKGPNRLTVEATSDQQPTVSLTVVGFGPMTFDSGAQLYRYTSPNGTPNPGSVTVTSSGGGSDSSAVTGEAGEPE